MNNFIFSHTSNNNLRGVHPHLINVVHLALEITDIDFCVIEGVRDISRQRKMVLTGKSQTLNSRHLTGHAVDLAPWINQSIRWDNWNAFKVIADAMKIAAEKLTIPIVWGGDWKTLKDGPHFELSRKSYL